MIDDILVKQDKGQYPEHIEIQKSCDCHSVKVMAVSETGLSVLIEDFDLEDVNDTGYEKDVDVEIIDGFYHQSVAFMNEKVRLFTDYWIKLYSNCC